MDGRLSSFLQYDYAEARTIATTLLTVSGGLLAGGVVFCEKFVELHRQPSRIWKWGMGGLYAFCAAGGFAGIALIMNYASMLHLLHRHQAGVEDTARFVLDVADHNLLNGLLLGSAALSMVIGLVCLFFAADKGRGARQTLSPAPTMAQPAVIAADGDSGLSGEVLRDGAMKRALQHQELAALTADLDQGLADLGGGRVRDVDADRIAARGKALCAAHPTSD